MSFDRDALAAACRAHGRVARVVVAEVRGSAPREVGASVLVWAGGQSGTIGGGALEFAAVAAARAREGDGPWVQTHALGPALGQCCGGSVTLVTEIWTEATLPEGPVVARAVAGGAMPLAVRRLLAQARNAGRQPQPALIQGWMVEPVTRPTRQIWIYGAGHVGRALVRVLAPLPDVAITWVDTHADRFPEGAGFVAANPADAVAHAPDTAEHLVLTYSHAFDLEICHRILGRPFGAVGLIGSATKWARFQKRLAALGHPAAQIARIRCPIGDPSLGKHPQAIALGVAAEMLRPQRANLAEDVG